MATITTKYSIGDIVYHASTTTERKQHPCPDCNGARKWRVTSPAGGEYTTACPRCTARYMSDLDLSLDYTAHVASARKLTIGSVQFNSANDAWDAGARYMCHETGVGSGSVYDEARLFPTEAEAVSAAEALASTANLTIKSVASLYNKTLEISDYQIENAALKLAADKKRDAGRMLWNLSDLFSVIEEADDKDAILEAVDDYKRRSWADDKEAVGEPT